MDVRKEFLEWVEGEIESLEAKIKETPEITKLWEIYRDAKTPFYRLFFPMGFQCGGIFDFQTLTDTLCHAWKDDGEMCIVYVQFQVHIDSYGPINMEDIFVVPFDTWTAKDHPEYVLKHLQFHRPEQQLRIVSVTAAPFYEDWVDFLHEALIPSYKILHDEYERQTKQDAQEEAWEAVDSFKKEFDRRLKERIVVKAQEWLEKCSQK